MEMFEIGGFYPENSEAGNSLGSSENRTRHLNWGQGQSKSSLDQNQLLLCVCESSTHAHTHTATLSGDSSVVTVKAPLTKTSAISCVMENKRIYTHTHTHRLKSQGNDKRHKTGSRGIKARVSLTLVFAQRRGAGGNAWRGGSSSSLTFTIVLFRPTFFTA